MAQIFDVTLDDPVGRPLRASPRIQPHTFRRDGVTYVPLSRRADDVVAFKATHPGRATPGPIRKLSHPGHDWLYVLQGRLRLAIGDGEHLLDAGEAAQFDTRLPHGLASATHEPVEVLNLMSRHGRRVHLRTQ